MNLAAIACANGLGHIKRLIKVCNCLCARAPELGVTLFCEGWQAERLAGWPEFDRFGERPANRINPVRLPLRWSPEPHHYGGWLTGWHRDIAAWGLERYDAVLSDNLIEPLLYAGQVTLSGSFFWHDVLAAAYPDHPDIARYHAWAVDLTRLKRPVMLVNRYFAMPATREQTDVVETGLISFYAPEGSAPDRRAPRNVLIALGSTDAAERLLNQVEQALPLLKAGSMVVLASERWLSALVQVYGRVKWYDFAHNPLHTVDLAIIRAGLGTISDCVAARIPMLTVDDNNPEIVFNQRRLAELGIGMTLAEALTRGKESPLVSQAAYQSMLAHFENLTLQGEEEAADFLLTSWGLN